MGISNHKYLKFIILLCFFPTSRSIVPIHLKSGCSDCASSNPNCEVVATNINTRNMPSPTCGFKITNNAVLDEASSISSGFLQASFFNSTCGTTNKLYGFIISLGVCTTGRDPTNDGNFFNFKLIPLVNGEYSLKRFRYSDTSCSDESLPPVIVRNSLRLNSCDCDCVEGLQVSFIFHPTNFPTWPDTNSEETIFKYVKFILCVC